jgi:ABC-type cobalamin/Fe3+-siderophores transport system ATPase subunit
MEFDLELKNFRSFPIDSPARLTLGSGFTSIVGVNNAGKSSLLRFFWEFRPIFAALTAEQTLQAATGQQYGIGGFQGVQDPEEVFCNLNDLDLEVTFSLRSDEGEEGDPPPDRVRMTFPRSGLGTVSLSWEHGGRAIANGAWAGAILQDPTQGLQYSVQPYIELFRELSTAVYLGPFRNAVNAGAANYYDLQIGSSFVAQWDQFKSGPNRRQNRAAVRLTDELRNIFGLATLELNASPDDQTLQVIADGQSYRLDEQGAGLAQFVVVFAFVATRKPSFVFIDEPESSLHPALQLDFLTTLATYTKYGVVFATHSIGLAKAVGQRVYSLRRAATGHTELRDIEATKSLAEFLGELSLSGYQELGFNKVLLVEGPTEVAAVQRLLRLYHAAHEVVLVPLGGRSLINARSTPVLSELTRLSTNVWVLIDSEKAKKDAPLARDRAAFIKNCQKLGFKTCVLERRALENYFSERAVKTAFGSNARALEPYQRLKNEWGKSDNWRVTAEMSMEELARTDLGKFLARVAK